MAWAEGLLGGLQGLAEAFGGQVKTQQDARLKAATDKESWKRDVLKGLMMQQMKPKSKDFYWDELVEGGDADVFDPEFLKKITSGFKGAGASGGGKTAPVTPKAPPVFGSPNPNPNPAPAGGRIRLKPLST